MGNIFLEQQKRDMQRWVERQEALLDVKRKQVEADEARIRQGLVKTNSAESMKTNLNISLPAHLVPGNVNELNKVIWPFFYKTDKLELAPNVNGRTSFTVTQEAGFTWMSYTKTVYLKDAITSVLTYVDPEDTSAAGEANGLTFTLRDSASTRQFHDKAMFLDHVGSPRFPTVLPTPVFILPNGNYEASIINSHPTNIYVVYMTFFGYRVRIDDAQHILSLVYG